MWKWFRKQVTADLPMEARLPGQGAAGHNSTGRLEPLSPTWVFISNYAQTEIAALRESNDKPLDADKTAAIRGQIKALKKLLELQSGPGNRPHKRPADNVFAGEEIY